MGTSFGALCTDFYINQKLGLKMDLPTDRETLLGFMERVRAEIPEMDRFKRYPDELALETARRDEDFIWLTLAAGAMRTGHVNPRSMDHAFRIHELALKLCPYFLSVTALDVDHMELTFGFDLDCKANHNQVIHDALMVGSPVREMLEVEGAVLTDIQPRFSISLNEACTLQAVFDVKGQTSRGEIRSGHFRSEPISVLLTIRRSGPVKHPDDLVAHLQMMRVQAERLASERVAPYLLKPLSEAISSAT